jgi:hypothetical protein
VGERTFAGGAKFEDGGGLVFLLLFLGLDFFRGLTESSACKQEWDQQGYGCNSHGRGAP